LAAQNKQCERKMTETSGIMQSYF